MTTSQALDDLRLRILARYPLLVLRTYEEQRWEEELAELALELERGLVTWSVTAGAQPALASNGSPPDPLQFLEQVGEYPPEHLFLLKDLHPYLDDPRVVRKLRDMLPRLVAEQKTLLLMGPIDDVPVELVKEVTSLELPLPGIEEMRSELHAAIAERPEGSIEMTPDQEEHLVKAVLGLTAHESRKAFARALQGIDAVSDEVYAALVAEKRHMVQGSDLLEFFDLDEGIGDIGGLDGLKEWIEQRAEAFSVDAQSRGISNPKGVLLAGVQGCGKSLSAKAIARLLGFPLVRMDLSNLLEQQRGSSEQNLREVLHLMETIAPSVLWLEEIDKAFAGFQEEAGGDATMSRIVGRFLTWLQEHTAPVFVVATANNISRLPPELLRRGRFDELFFVDLPNYDERKAIFTIHLQKRGWKADKFDIDELATTTESYSGAEIEQIINSAIIESYSSGRMMTQGDLLDQKDLTVPLSKTMEDAIFELREWARTRCRPATTDNRVLQIMEEEERRGETGVEDGADGKVQIRWKELAEYGQFDAAVLEYVRYRDITTIARLMEEFAPYFETKGEFGLVLRADTKVVVWTRMSQELADIVSDYIAGKRLYLHPAEASLYEGAWHPALPPMTAVTDDKVERPHWLPSTLRLIPLANGHRKYGRLARIKLKS
ncbi:MAG: AAA family ATPase [Planctomycetaceae bacterium]|nr:AAA family ATPase [Planctomycetaceae bacterium]